MQSAQLAGTKIVYVSASVCLHVTRAPSYSYATAAMSTVETTKANWNEIAGSALLLWMGQVDLFHSLD